MTYVGGTRERLIKENFYHMLRDSLEALGWFDTGRQHRDVTFMFEPADYQSEVMPNKISIWDEDMFSLDDELGSNFAEHRMSYFVDVYAENGSVGLALSGDVMSILQGRMPSIDRGAPNLDVLDISLATPVHLFYVEIEDIERQRGHAFSRPWERYWYQITLTLIDFYGNEDDGP